MMMTFWQFAISSNHLVAHSQTALYRPFYVYEDIIGHRHIKRERRKWSGYTRLTATDDGDHTSGSQLNLSSSRVHPSSSHCVQGM